MTSGEGLSEAEAAARLARYGPNTLAQERPHVLRAVLGKLWGPVPWLLEAAVVLELAAGKVTEALIVGILVVFNGVLGYVQEGRARDALALLRRRLAVRARVCRGGHWQLIDAERLVPGDLVHVRLGDIVPADVTASDGTAAVDQSVLTGESAEVEVGRGGTLYSGAIVRRGEASGVVTATGAHTYFGRTAELVRGAKTASHLEETIFKVVWSLLVMDGALVVAILAYGLITDLPARELLPFVLILVVATVPVALPATFTLATSLGAEELASAGVLVTHLTAIEEAAAMDLLCTDKTGTITENRLSIVAVRPYGRRSDAEVLALAAAASDEATQDPIDLAVLAAAAAQGAGELGQRAGFVPFDPATKRSEARIVSADGTALHVAKGAPAVLGTLATTPPGLAADVEALAADGARVLAVAADGGGTSGMEVAGLLALGDRLRPDSAGLVRQLKDLGIRVVMVTGDAAVTAVAVARQVGIGERLATAEHVRGRKTGSLDFDVVAGVLPADKLALVEQAQRGGHVVGMTGDGVNDAPALKRAEVGVAVADATDVAKDAASLVLTGQGLSDMVTAVETGRRVYQRMLTYTLNKITKTFQVSLFLGLGLLVTGSFVTTPRLVLLLLFANDFVTMSIATDRVGFSARPDRWHVRSLSFAALGIAVPWLVLSFATFYIGRDVLGLSLAGTQTLVFVMLVATGQATVYLVRERHHLWASRPSTWMLAATALDVVIVTVLASRGILMAPVSLTYLAALLGAVLAATLILDMLKVPLLEHMRLQT
ncbi:plasma-membrane proton-efflux P-type ATPase [Streptomyces sp. NPDC004542]|uniref:plasma-membrane proton-efflux P-type ATPase n=1 Tax=Streptomyces sp. NPDC004542 TaxID=3154281 RepID=UPI0033AEDC18